MYVGLGSFQEPAHGIVSVLLYFGKIHFVVFSSFDKANHEILYHYVQVKMMNIVTTKQEKLIEEKDLAIQENQSTISSLKESNSQRENEVEY